MVLVTFTVGSFKLRDERFPDNAPEGLEYSMSLNLKEVILLAEGVRPYSGRVCAVDEPLGVVPPEPAVVIIRSPSGNIDKENIRPLVPVDDLPEI